MEGYLSRVEKRSGKPTRTPRRVILIASQTMLNSRGISGAVYQFAVFD